MPIVSPFGEWKYQLYDDRDEVGNQVEFVGYGLPGIGEQGWDEDAEEPLPKRSGQNRIDVDGDRLRNAVQVIKLTGGPDGGDFVLRYDTAKTVAIPHNVSAADLQAALMAAAETPASPKPLENNIRVGGKVVDGTDTYYFVEFINDLANDNVLEIEVEANNLTKMGTEGPEVVPDTRIEGGSIYGNWILALDFDSGSEANDAIGLYYGKEDHEGLDRKEAMPAKGDSGGPLFLEGSKQIAGVVSALVPAESLDVPIPDKKAPKTASFGEIALFSRVSSFTQVDGINNRDDFLPTTRADERYHIVLDMNFQVVGHEDTPGEDVQIVAKMNGDKLELWVDLEGADDYEGLYFSEQASKIISLTIRGSNDNETIIIDNPLTLGGKDGTGADAKIVLEGGEGDDTFIIGNPATGNLDTLATPIFVDGEEGHNELTVNDVATSQDPTWTITDKTLTRRGKPSITYADEDGVVNVEKVTLNTGSGVDFVNINSTAASVTEGYFVATKSGKDTSLSGPRSTG